jgi:hypothetical protein
MIRRSMLLTMGGSVLASCSSKPALTTVARPLTSQPTKIERLLLWLPADGATIDVKETALEFVAQLSPFGVAVKVGRSTTLELDREDDQKPIISAFQPTHRLEIDVARSITMGSGFSAAALKAALYDANGKDPVRVYVVTQRGSDGTKFVNLIVMKLQADGYLVAPNA